LKICAIDLKANNTILVVLEKNNEKIQYIDLKIKKIELEDDEIQENIISYSKVISEFLQENKIEQVLIKKRAKKGSFSGGANTFKVEAIIQLNSVCKVELISAQTINAFEKKRNIEFPNNLKKYQEQAYLCALSFLQK
jgi:4-alpha-glucanotransferase